MFLGQAGKLEMVNSVFSSSAIFLHMNTQTSQGCY
jgi:hypothetical protein